MRTIEAALRLWGIPLWPPTPVAWKALAATLKMGRYSSASIYFSTYRTTAERMGYALDELSVRSIKDYTRSCLKGVLVNLLALGLCPSSYFPFFLVVALHGWLRGL